MNDVQIMNINFWDIEKRNDILDHTDSMNLTLEDDESSITALTLKGIQRSAT